MSHIRKLVFLFIIAMMVLSACQPAATAEPIAVPTEPTEAEAEMPEAGLACSPNCQYSDLVVGFLQTGSEGGWRAANTASFKETADQLGLTL